MSEFGLGRRHAPDPRDAEYPMRPAIPVTAERPTWKYWWDRGWWGNQGATPQCVGYAWTHWIEDGPVTHAPKHPGGLAFDPSEVYRNAQHVDEWPGTGYDGTSVRGGAKVLTKMDLISEYRWAWDLETVLDALRYAGPVVVGTWWYSEMSTPDAKGIIRVGGNRAGGHAYVLNGFNENRGLVRMKNSWGRGWGDKGRAWIPFAHMERLIREDGEACLAIEKPTS